MAERILITGGAGFIGSHLAEACLASGYDVRVLDNLTMGQAKFLDAETELIVGDIRDFDTCLAASKGCAGIVHLAAMSRSAASLDSVDICTSNNIIGTQNILNAAREAGVRKIIYAGSSTFYGSQKPPHLESMRPQYLNFYGLSKHMGEEMCLLFDRLYGLQANVLRFFNVYGPRLTGEGQYALVMSIFLNQLRQGKPLTIHGSGEQARDFVHVKDVVRAILLAYESPVHGEVFNVGTGIPITVNQLADFISPNQIHEARRAGDAEITQADIQHIKDKLNWKPEIDFETGMGELLALTRAETSEVVH